MKGISLKKQSWLAWYHSWITGSKELPISLCKYFWTLIFGLLLTLLLFHIPLMITLIVPKFRKNPTKYSFGFWWVIIMISQLIFILVNGFVANWLKMIIVILCGIGGFAIFVGVVFLIFYCIEKAKMKGWIKEKPKKEENEEKPKAE